MKSDVQAGLPGLCEKLDLSDEVRKQLEMLVNVLRAKEELTRHHFQLPRVLLFGNPAIDQMQIAAALAAASARPLVAADARELKGTVAGQSSEKIGNLVERACAQAPCILFINHIDWIATRRGSPNDDDRSTEIVSELLMQIMSPRQQQVLFAASADNPDDLDSAVRM